MAGFFIFATFQVTLINRQNKNFMATDTAEDVKEEVKTEKAFDLTQGKFVEKEVGKPSEKAPEKKEEEKKPENKEDKKEEKKEEKPVEKSIEPDYNKFLKDKFGFESEEELAKYLDNTKGLAKDLEEAKKPKEYEFKSEKEKAIAGFLKDWDMDNVGEGIEMAGRLMKMDPEKINEKIALQEKYIIENSDISRDKAIKLFNKEYDEKYVLDKEKFEDAEEFKEEQELADIKREKAANAARKFLLEKKEALKYKEKEKKEEKMPEKVEIPKETVDKYVGEVNKFFSPSQGEDFNQFIYQLDDDEHFKISVQFTKEEVANMKKEATAYLQSLSPYDKDKKIPNFDSGKLVAQIADILYGDVIKERMMKEAKKNAQTLRIEQLANVKPDKKSGGGGNGKQVIPGFTEQFAELAKKEAEKRAKKK